MNTGHMPLNPFSMMLEPELVLQAMERSEQLRSLHHRECHPLDKPLIPFKNADQEAFDAGVDAAPDEPLQDDSGAPASRYGLLN